MECMWVCLDSVSKTTPHDSPRFPFRRFGRRTVGLGREYVGRGRKHPSLDTVSYLEIKEMAE